MADYDNYSTGFGAESLPFSLEAEQSVLGAVLLDSACLDAAMENLRPEHFFRREHQALFDIMIRKSTLAQPVDFVTVLDTALREEVFESDSDAKIYLSRLVQIVPSTGNIEAYARIVREKSYIRSLVAAAREIIENSQSGDAQTLMDSAEQKIFEIRQGREGSQLLHIRPIMLELYDKLQRLSGEDRDKYSGIPTGFNELDNLMTGLNRSDLILIAARPGMGKTSFAINIAMNVAKKAKKKVAVFSLEMSREQLVERILSTEALIPGSKMRSGELSDSEWVAIAEAAQRVVNAPVYIDDSAGVTVPEMKARLRRQKDLGLVIVDYLQLMSGTSHSDNRVQVVSEMTRQLKMMAKELNVPVIVLSQLSRGPEGRSDKRPMLSDLRESGSIEQDADIVLMLYRDSYYNRESTEQHIAECNVSKNRHGETGTVMLAWDGAHTLFSSLETYRHEE